ncbi:hypothetical protein EV356DRAFT_93552 [Viridothelium virens]|uniref:Uncharacterized protein n=1 Tax=Viridothelium virens TaxID=1048519 RepID=A0A6A6HEW6_VIRVR|nr:hypothetical protein EV356DRAFT_93552 [Viridothelium virens]
MPLRQDIGYGVIYLCKMTWLTYESVHRRIRRGGKQNLGCGFLYLYHSTVQAAGPCLLASHKILLLRSHRSGPRVLQLRRGIHAKRVRLTSKQVRSFGVYSNPAIVNGGVTSTIFHLILLATFIIIDREWIRSRIS